jgi:hypothetical protein
MFREPVARAVSGYSWFGPEFKHYYPPINATDYAMRVRGTAVKMVAGQADGYQCNTMFMACDTTIVPDVAKAVDRLHSDFAFVGLTEHWSLSICLFHVMFGGTCRQAELENSRASDARASVSRRLTDVMRRVHDPWDTELYHQATLRFWADVKKHGVDVEKCRAVCPSKGLSSST